MKECRYCGEFKAASEFRKGHRRCRGCAAEYDRHKRLVNYEETLRREKEVRRRHRVARAKYAREWRSTNREKVSEYNRQWAQAHPEVYVANAHRRRAHSATLFADDVAYITILRNDPCSYCGDAAGTVDHIEPLNGGGDGGWENLTAACRACNAQKHTTGLLAFLATRAQ